MHSYRQLSNVNFDFHLWKEIFSGVLQESIFGPRLFNININGIFCFVDEAFLSSYVDDTLLYSVQNNHFLNQSILKKNFIHLKNMIIILS